MSNTSAPASRGCVVITGVTRGLGRAMTLEFVRRGHTVVGCGRNAEGLARLRSECPAPHDFSAVDVAQDRAVAAWAHQVVERHGAPDLLINNAAMINANAALWRVPAEVFSQVVDVNIKGVASVLRHFLPAMIRRGQGVVVNFSSGWGRSADAEVAPYCATKWAIEGLTQALAMELPNGMAAVALNPGIIDTDMLRSCFGGSAGHYVAPEHWATYAVPYLLRLGPAQNGQSLTVEP